MYFITDQINHLGSALDDTIIVEPHTLSYLSKPYTIRRNQSEVIYMHLDHNLNYVRNKYDARYFYSGYYQLDKPTVLFVPNQCHINVDIVSSYKKICGEQILGIWIQLNCGYAFYVNIDTLTMHAPKATALIGGYLTGNVRGLITHAGSYDWYKKYEALANNTLPQNMILRVAKGQFSREKITAAHHTLLRPEEIIYCSDKVGKVKVIAHEGKIEMVEKKVTNYRDKYVINLLKKAAQLDISVESSIATMILYLYVTTDLAANIFNDCVEKSNNNTDFIETLKIESIVAKQKQHSFREDLNYIFELNVLVNRINSKVDWDKEEKARTTKMQVVGIDKDTIKARAINIFKQARMEGKHPYSKEWDDYWSCRWAQMPTGSFVSQHKEDIAEKSEIKGVNLRNKTTVLSSIGKREFKYYYNRTPEIYATTSTKYEWGKVRALYGCDITSYLMADYSMGLAEACLPDYFPVGKNAEQSKIQQVMARMDKGTPFCYDYDDFNSQHSTSSMKAVIEAWLEVFRPYLSQQQVLAGYWTRDSIDKMQVQYEHTGNTIGIKGTLFSGWRHTAFMNTVLNRIYLEEAGVKQMLYSIHNGDDMYGVCRKIKDAMIIYKKSIKLGIRAQLTKMNIGTIAEFLRVDGLAKDKTGAQYLTRACATAVHSRIESEAAITLTSVLDATQDRIKSIIDRGGNMTVAARIINLLNKNAATVFSQGTGIARLYANRHPIQGGNSDTAEIAETRLKPIFTSEPDKIAQSVAYKMRKGAHDYLDFLRKKYGISIDNANYTNIDNMNLALVRANKVTLIEVPEERWNIKYFRGVWKIRKYDSDVIHLAKLKLLRTFEVVMPGQDNPYFIQWLKQQPNQNQIMNIMF
jgi:hypothetical protein